VNEKKIVWVKVIVKEIYLPKLRKTEKYRHIKHGIRQRTLKGAGEGNN
jgi:hypothetical protein